jgi:ADP-ribosyl-[dinitrogen reductase] hydrolase
LDGGVAEPPSRHSRIRGCLLGGAAGDALGAAVEKLYLHEIRARFGPGGIEAYAPIWGRAGAITDDTQMTLFTAEGLLRAHMRGQATGVADVAGVIHHAYLRWLLTQGEQPRADLEIGTDGWLWGVSALHRRRGPGKTCRAGLIAARGFGDPVRAENDSKGCGGVMRVAPVGLFVLADRAFALGAATAALTHGHPSAFLAAGHMARTVAGLMQGRPLLSALDAADAELGSHPGHAELAALLARARALAAHGRPCPEALETLGSGWSGHEALAIAVCCALAARDFADGIRLAANHSGDTDSTAAITGNLLGALLGEAAIGPEWLVGLELRDEILQMADDLGAALDGALTGEGVWVRYPGW